jgi:hypothetical protein
VVELGKRWWDVVFLLDTLCFTKSIFISMMDQFCNVHVNL